MPSSDHQIQTVDNPFGGNKDKPLANRAGSAAAASDEARAMHEVQSAMVIAKRFPRDPKEAMDRILNAFTRKSLAEVAMYSYSRGGTEITGPSIRAAEVMAQQWGNMNFGIRELSRHGGESTVEAYAWDLETNVRQSKIFSVGHKRNTRSGSYDLTDERDIYEHVANQGARRLRACILGVIPGDVQEAAVHQADVTLQSEADTSPEAIKKLVEAFEQFSVTKEQLEKRIQRHMDSIRPAQIVQLRKIYVSMRDGMSRPADWFEDVVAGPQERGEGDAGAADIADRVSGQGQGESAPAPASEPSTASTPDEPMAIVPNHDEAIETRRLDWIAVGKEIGVEPQPGETLADFAERVKAEQQAGTEPPGDDDLTAQQEAELEASQGGGQADEKNRSRKKK